jgi:hypothetical protein
MTPQADILPSHIAMKRILTITLAAIGAWVLVSFAGTMLDTVRAEFWTQSLMWSLLTTLVLGPLMILATTRADTPETDVSEAVSAPDQPPAFVEDDADSMRTLWPTNESSREEKETA